MVTDPKVYIQAAKQLSKRSPDGVISAGQVVYAVRPGRVDRNHTDDVVAVLEDDPNFIRVRQAKFREIDLFCHISRMCE